MLEIKSLPMYQKRLGSLAQRTLSLNKDESEIKKE